MSYEIQDTLLNWGFFSYREMFGEIVYPYIPEDISVQLTLDRFI